MPFPTDSTNQRNHQAPDHDSVASHSNKHSTRSSRALGYVGTMTFATSAVLVLVTALTVFATQLGISPYQVPVPLADLLDQANGSSLYRYPTDITRNIVPKQIHSHNDYWRDVPFYSALSVGAISVEADVWLYNGTLYVGHEQNALKHERTFKSLYIEPILSVLEKTNSKSAFVTEETMNGVFDTDSSQTLYLWIDCKTDGEPTFRAAISELAPLRSAGYLTTYSTSAGVTPGPVTVIGTGNTPLNLVQGVSPRDYFWDAPLPDLDGDFSNITSDVSPIASTQFSAVFGVMRTGIFNETGIKTLKDQVSAAAKKGIGARYWDTPGFPLSARNRIWTQLWNAGVALINVDDLVGGAGFAEQANWWLPGEMKGPGTEL